MTKAYRAWVAAERHGSTVSEYIRDLLAREMGLPLDSDGESG